MAGDQQAWLQVGRTGEEGEAGLGGSAPQPILWDQPSGMQPPRSCQAWPLALGCTTERGDFSCSLKGALHPVESEPGFHTTLGHQASYATLDNILDSTLPLSKVGFDRWPLPQAVLPQRAPSLPHTPSPACPNPSFTMTSRATFSTMQSIRCAPLCCAWLSCVEGHPS